jgi:glycosyltransferase involved in cell wall biosynthesis
MKVLHVFGPEPDAEVLERASRVARGLPREIKHFIDDADNLVPFDVPGAAALSEPLPLTGKVSLPRYTRIAQGVAAADLVLTYGPTALDAIVTKRIFGKKLPPVVHHESGKASGNAYERLARRVVLPAAAAVIKAGEIEDGVDVGTFSPGKPGAALAGLERQRGDFVIGCISPLRSGLGLAALVRAAAVIPNARLAVIGGGPDANALAGEARRAGLGNRLVLPGRVRDLAKAMRQFDLLAAPSGGIGRFTLLEALATGLPVVVPDGVAAPPKNPCYRDADGFRDALLRLAGNRDLRERLATANREAAVARHDSKRMIAGYSAVYGAAAGVDIR